MWVLLFQRKKNPYHAAPHSHAQTHVSTIKETHSPLSMSGHATILICFINTHGYTHKNTQLQAHKIRSACASRATKSSLHQGRGGHCVFLCVQWVAIRLEVFATVNSPRSSHVSFISRVTYYQYIAANRHTAVANVHSSGSSHSSLSHWKISVHEANVII